jgi:hypothetical protein
MDGQDKNNMSPLEKKGEAYIRSGQKQYVSPRKLEAPRSL